MSLDIALKGGRSVVPYVCPRCGHQHECEEIEVLYAANITHNLGAMASAAGIYDFLWRSPENHITKAQQLIGPIQKALSRMKRDPDRFRALNAENGYGTYEQFVPWLKELLEACKRYPNAIVSISRSEERRVGDEQRDDAGY